MARITYLEDALFADTQGTLRRHLLDSLRQAEHRVRGQLRQPQPAAQFQALEQCANACASAVQVIEILWGRYHSPMQDIRGAR
ncbi:MULTISPECIES: EscE/YscE/SsaE family type III secretion system needle protein co-chaperone [Pseudomonas]|uniref:EscE/YscE/SsaE family type III secretion system needle protein co-chaperone n=1 Tax=Pseudomonas chlororaphis TaxID=587753 RepID=A0AB34C145_9PSED|nr:MULTISPECIES: EscE/YscE/SsaE family type III secretion system needle protein co-chaperone [Pseudomonas]KAA5839278.1 EscE/YscE/SsaE family type III secretion system needle protein co-chaperone [Pseudomonas chlororaphis]PMY31804.1 EscE/YscE/SsaE family type III secretion system needle protein co-chaperone [Pseudomonas sp. GW456-L14]PMY48982.1 EscE/YscE/SsaE family type III secretion system needle protein co-chaperone [Pseudomonas sp. GW456-L12]PMY64412.1 EscE/YscE/SsaE family type III secretio